MKLRDYQCVFLRLVNQANPSQFQVLMARLPTVQAMREGRFPCLPFRIFAPQDMETAQAIVQGFVPPEVATWDSVDAYQGPQTSLVDVIHKGWQETSEAHKTMALDELPMTTGDEEPKERAHPRDIGGPVIFFGPFHGNMKPLEKQYLAGATMRLMRAFQEALEKAQGPQDP